MCEQYVTSFECPECGDRHGVHEGTITHCDSYDGEQDWCKHGIDIIERDVALRCENCD
ncbi:hypothetical protein OC834_001913 [Tilletia horrida]|nr:hypothetical protein OC834_001913 [Tilletia horrida]